MGLIQDVCLCESKHKQRINDGIACHINVSYSRKTIRKLMLQKYDSSYSKGHLFVCPMCQRRLTRDFHVGHILADKHGGETSFANTIAMCPECNKVLQENHLLQRKSVKNSLKYNIDEFLFLGEKENEFYKFHQQQKDFFY